MAFTGQLGTSDSKPGNFVPGLASSSPPPPPPPPPPAEIRAFSPPFGTPLRHPVNRGSVTLHVVPLPLTAPAGSLESAFDNTQVRPGTMFFAPVPGPWSRHKMVPVRTVVNAITEFGTTPYSPPPVPSEIAPTGFSHATPVPGPWNGFGSSVFRPAPSSPPAPPPPNVPPTPGTSFATSNRTKVLSVPRAPDASDFRVRSHIDAVAGIMNSLLRLGYIRSLGDGEFAINGGGISLPRPPAATDDASVGAVVGMTYYDSLNDRVYVCTNNSSGSAVWKLVS